MKIKKRYIQRVGCKQSIVFDILKVIMFYSGGHTNKTFVDLFGGGGSVSANATHFFPHVIYNEINKEISDLFVAVQDDEFIQKIKRKWISREHFKEILSRGPQTDEENLILTAWSFGNDRSSYIYGKNIERRKEITHKIIFCDTEQEYKDLILNYNEEKLGHFDKYGGIWTCFLRDDDWYDFSILSTKERRYYKFGSKANYYRVFEKWFDLDLLIEKRGNLKSKKDKLLVEEIKEIYEKNTGKPSVCGNLQNLESLERLERLSRLENLESLERLERLQRLESLERLERLSRLQSLERLEIHNKDYRGVKLPDPDDCVIYCDPPYRGTMGYEVDFDFEAFDEYILSLEEKGYTIFVSEYSFPFGEVVWSRNKTGFISQKESAFTGKEKLYFITNTKGNLQE